MPEEIDLAQHLMPTETAAKKDRDTFNKLCNGVITANQAIQLFKENNGITFDIDEQQFIQYIAGLGYRIRLTID